MKAIFASLLAAAALVLSACATTTPINNLVLPPVSTIEGAVTEIDENGFVLADDSGSIYVLARLPKKEKMNLSLREKIRVYGNLQGGEQRIFDGYVIRKATGEQIIINNPTPHMGIIIQGRFN